MGHGSCPTVCHPAVREHEGKGCVDTDKRSEKMNRKKLYLLAILVLVMFFAFRAI